MKLKSKSIIFIVIICLCIFWLISELIYLYIDFLWFESLGYRNVFIKSLCSRVGLFLLGVGISFFILSVTYLLAQAIVPSQVRVVNYSTIELIDKKKYKPYFNRVVYASIVLVSVIFGIVSQNAWKDFILFLHAQDFNDKDPLFHKDIGFYIFKLPFIIFVYEKLIFILFLALLLTIVTFIIYRQIVITLRSLSFAKSAKMYIYVIMSIILFLLSIGCRLSIYELLYSTKGTVFGASYTDIHATLPALKLLSFGLILAALAFFINAFTKGFIHALYFLSLPTLIWIIGVGLYPYIIQKFVVVPNEIEKELPYIKLNIKYTQRGYKLDKVKRIEFSPKDVLTDIELIKNEQTLQNIRLWDYSPLLKTYSQLQEIRPYYKFFDVDCDRYKINGRLTQLVISPRELSYEELLTKLWVNEHLIYTHGWGVVASPINKFTKEGLPEFYVKDIPSISFIEEIKITQPRIYYGELKDNYCIVNTKIKEFDYPRGEKNLYYVYGGKGGVKIGSLFRRILFAIRFGDFKILLSQDITSESRVMYYRNIKTIVKKIFPHLVYDDDPYIVISKEGRLVWFIDGYVSSDRFPYSTPFEGNFNYIRNSVKVLIDAYDGSLDFYIFDEEDPIIKAYAEFYSGLFKSKNNIKPDLLAHIKYPKTIFLIQSKVYAMYHMQDPRVFYNKEDLWKESIESSEEKVYYMMIKLPEEEKEKFVLMMSYTPIKKDNLIAWLVAKCDPQDYGELSVYNFPKQRLIYGPKQIEARINQDPEIAKQLTLWDQKGSVVIRGNILIIPIENALIYVQPLYLAAEGRGDLPELKKVIVAFEDRLVMESTLEEALGILFGYKKTKSISAEKLNQIYISSSSIISKLEGLIKKAIASYDALESAAAENNWQKFGQSLDELKSSLYKLKANINK